MANIAKPLEASPHAPISSSLSRVAPATAGQREAKRPPPLASVQRPTVTERESSRLRAIPFTAQAAEASLFHEVSPVLEVNKKVAFESTRAPALETIEEPPDSANTITARFPPLEPESDQLSRETAHYGAPSRSPRNSQPSSPPRSAKPSQASLAVPTAFSASVPPHMAAQRSDLRVRMSFAKHQTNGDVVEDDEEQQLTAQPLSAVSYPGTPWFGFHANESQATFQTAKAIRPSTRYFADQEDDLSIVQAFLEPDDNDTVPLISSQPRAGPQSRPISEISIDLPAPSVHTVVQNGTLSLELKEMCDFIADHKSLQSGTIKSIETYGEKMGGFTHRFVIMELQRTNKKDIWLRLERKRELYISTLNFLAASGKSVANDVAQLAARKEKLVGGPKILRENLQLFRVPPTLLQLERFLRVIDEEIPSYHVWPDNCWFFCSFLQQHIGILNQGYYEQGKAQHTELAPHIRERVNTRLRPLYPHHIAILAPLGRNSPTPRSKSSHAGTRDRPPRPPTPQRQGTNDTVASDPTVASASSPQSIPATLPKLPSSSKSLPLSSIRSLKDQPRLEGDIWFAISKRWWDRWESACIGRASKTPSTGPLGPVDNSDISEEDPQPGVKYALLDMPPMMEDEHIEMVPQEAHELLEEWYGPTKYPFQYEVTPVAPDDWKTHIELYPRRIRVFPISSSGKPIPPVYLLASRNSPISVIIDAMNSAAVLEDGMELVRVDINRADLPWGEVHPLSASEFINLNSEKVTLLSLKEGDAAYSYIDEITPALKESFVAVASATVKAAQASYEPPQRQLIPVGAKGLWNLGETCYMNSALQCIGHVPILTNYLLSGQHINELNLTNPLGTGGVVAKAYAEHLKGFFASSPTIAHAARDFKHAVSSHASQFATYAQQDSHELLACLLDNLHEDLNRVREKLYIPNPEWTGGSEGGNPQKVLELGEAFWKAYKKRNDSVVVDLFQGQYKSSIICPSCNHASITFDPFMYLSVPIPVHRVWAHQIHIVSWKSSKLSLVEVQLSYDSSIGSLKKLVAEHFSLDHSQLFAAEVLDGRWYKVFSDDDFLAEIKSDDKIFIYEILVPPSSVVVPVYHTLSSSDDSTSPVPVGFPTFVAVSTGSDVRKSAVVDEVFTSAQQQSLSQSLPVLKDISLSRGGSNEGVSFTSPTPISVVFGASEPVPWEDRAENTGANGEGAAVQMLDVLIASWAVPSGTIASSEAAETIFWDNFTQHPNPLSSLTSEFTKDTTISLESCLAALTAPETLTSSWYCSSCKTHHEPPTSPSSGEANHKATGVQRHFSLWRAPAEVLIVHLKRFSSYGTAHEKLTDFVDFPVRGLDLGEWVGKDKLEATLSPQSAESRRGLVYDLAAVSEHEGTVLGSGHYRAYAYNESDDQWYHYADARVKKARAEDAVNQHAYMLFYVRRKE
ncbi:cysteine proteinase [Clavulina sp. PMI_390]|nr:cysteine proteinase [Clavulina sp. PMI_390]